MTCNRMLIMYDGKILAADTPDNLQRLMAGNSQIIAEIAAPADELREAGRKCRESNNSTCRQAKVIPTLVR